MLEGVAYLIQVLLLKAATQVLGSEFETQPFRDPAGLSEFLTSNATRGTGYTQYIS